jgi:hypothetical protein
MLETRRDHNWEISWNSYDAWSRVAAPAENFESLLRPVPATNGR